MMLQDIAFTQYYHGYVTIEGDELTSELNGLIKVTDRDCYMLCSSYVGKEGMLHFNVLSIGSTWENCTRGLHYKKMLGDFDISRVAGCEAGIVDPDEDMIHKNEPFLEQMDADTDEGILKAREDERLNGLRDLWYPDDVLVGIVTKTRITEYYMEVTGIQGPFLTGKLLEEPGIDKNIHNGDPVWSLPYMAEDGCRLYALYAGSHLNQEQKDKIRQIVEECDAQGISFSGLSLRS